MSALAVPCVSSPHLQLPAMSRVGSHCCDEPCRVRDRCAQSSTLWHEPPPSWKRFHTVRMHAWRRCPTRACKDSPTSHHITSHHTRHVSCTSCTLRDDCQGKEEHTDPALSSEGGGFHTGDTAAPGCHPNTMRWGGRARSGSPWCCPPVMTSPRPRPWPTPLSTCSVSEVVVVEGVKF